MSEFRQDYESQADNIKDLSAITKALYALDEDDRDLKCSLRTDMDPTSNFMFAPEESAFLTP